MNHRTPVGAAGVCLPGAGDLQRTRRLPYAAEKHRETRTALTFEIPAGLLASDSRNSKRAARTAPDWRLLKALKRMVWIGRGLVEC